MGREFCAYRAGMVQMELPAPPDIAITKETGRLKAAVVVSLDFGIHPCRPGPGAVVEEKGGGARFPPTAARLRPS